MKTHAYTINYALITHGAHPRNMSKAERSKLQTVRNLREFNNAELKSGNARLEFEYCRKVESLASLPWLKHLLSLAQKSHGAIITDDFRRIFSRCEISSRASLFQELSQYGQHFFDIRTKRLFGTLTPEQKTQLFFMTGPARFVYRAKPPNAEPTPWGRNQVKAATKASAFSRGHKADKKAEQLSEIRAELTEDGRAPTLKEIAEEANVRGLTTNRDNQWTASTVQRALKRLQT